MIPCKVLIFVVPPLASLTTMKELQKKLQEIF